MEKPLDIDLWLPQVQCTCSRITSISGLQALKKISASKNTEVVAEVELLSAGDGRESEHPRGLEHGDPSP